jgi:RNA polymerase sigma factor (sigma-70 family)
MEKKLTDTELIIRIKKSGCEDSLKTLIQRHSPLCFDICKKYAPALSSKGIDVNDVASEKEYLIYKSILSYNPLKKTKFSTWLGNQMRYYCLNTLNKSRLIATEDSQLDYFINKDCDCSSTKMQEQIDYIDNLISQLKDKRIKSIIKARYFNNPNKKTPWNKVASEVGVSTQTAINLHAKGMNILRRKMNNKNIYAIDKI